MGCINFIMGLPDVGWLDALQGVVALCTKVAPGMVGDCTGITAVVCGGAPAICGGLGIGAIVLVLLGLLIAVCPPLLGCCLPSLFALSGLSGAYCTAIPGFTEIITPMMGAITAAGAAVPGP